MATRLRDLGDTNFGILNNSKRKHIMRYNASAGKFDLIDIDTALSTTQTIPQTFVDVVEELVDPNNIQFDGIDAGSF
jgi:hypothetical protein